jgi:hypothetical protein
MQRLRDCRDQIGTEIAQKFEDARNVRRPHPKSKEGFLSPRFARGIRQAEIDYIDALRYIKIRGRYRPASEYLDGFIDVRSFDDMESTSKVQSALQLGFRDYQDIEADLYGPSTIRIEETSPGRWDVYWNGTRHDKGTLIAKDSPTPVRDAEEYLRREHVIFSGDEIRMHILREAKKRGRKPIGERAMTGAERVKEHRARLNNACKPHRRPRTAAADLHPLGRTAAVTPSRNDHHDSADPRKVNRIATVDSKIRRRATSR